MYCPNCGSEVTEGSLFCGECGCRLQEMDMGKTKKNNLLGKTAKIAAEIVGIAGCILFVLGITGKLDKIGEELGKTEIFGGAHYKGVTVGDAIDNIIAYYTKGEAGSKNEPNVNKPDVDELDVNEAAMNEAAMNDPAAESGTGQKDVSSYQKAEGMDNTQPTEETNSALDAIASAIAEPGTMESGTQETDSAYAMEWDGYYARDKGPGSGILIWSADESGVDFAAGIGSSGYLAYRNLQMNL